MKEIGGEFYSYDTSYESKKNNKSFDDIVYTLSGRTSIDYILYDVKTKCNVNKAYLPTYCCDCMIQPFVKHGIEVVFYNILIGDEGLCYELNEAQFLDENGVFVLFAMDYFGFDRGMSKKIFADCGSNVIRINDRTHSFFLDNASNSECEYEFASMRKWSRFAGLSVTVKKEGNYDAKLAEEIWRGKEIRKKAADMKNAYIHGAANKKSEFLDLFAVAENILDEEYSMFKADKEDIAVYRMLDREKIIHKRRQNARFLMDNLKEIDGIKLLFSDVKGNDCPLFVPILVEKKIRDKLKQHLIDKSIYCPVHWGLSKYHSFDGIAAKEIYDREISLICDQRYDIKDMERIGCEIKSFFKRL